MSHVTSRHAVGAVVVAMATAACGASAVVPPRPPDPVRCPLPAPAVSSSGGPRALAPGRPTETAFCVYRIGGRRVAYRQLYRGGPLDHALNSSLASDPPGTGCGAVATLPTVIVLTYHGAPTRHVVVDIGGCSLITSGHSSRVLVGPALGVLSSLYEKPFRRG